MDETVGFRYIVLFTGDVVRKKMKNNLIKPGARHSFLASCGSKTHILMTTTEQSIQIANTIRQQLLTLGRTKVWSWGANSWMAVDRGLSFKVQGFLFHGQVVITLGGNDLYTIQLIKSKKVVKEYTSVFFEDMVDLIDTSVEYTGENYASDVDKAVYSF